MRPEEPETKKKGKTNNPEANDQRRRCHIRPEAEAARNEKGRGGRPNPLERLDSGKK
jgi:hypothetical protein